MTRYQRKDSGSEDETANRVPDLEKDDFATRRARMNQPKHIVPFNSFIIGPYTNKDKGKLEDSKKPLQVEKQEHARCAFMVFLFLLQCLISCCFVGLKLSGIQKIFRVK